MSLPAIANGSRPAIRKLFDAIDIILERYAESEPNVARGPLGVGASRRRAGDGHEVSERTNRPVRIQTQIRDIGAGIGEMRRIGEIERLSAHLQFPALAQAEIAEQPGIEVGHSGSSQNIQSGITEAGRGNGAERERVEVRHVIASLLQLSPLADLLFW